MNELELIEKAKDKDEEAFNKLIKKYNKDIDIFRKGGCHGKHKKSKN